MSNEKPVDAVDDAKIQLEAKPKVYALFYASWCPHSRRFLPIFEEYQKEHSDECLKVMVDFKENL